MRVPMQCLLPLCCRRAQREARRPQRVGSACSSRWGADARRFPPSTGAPVFLNVGFRDCCAECVTPSPVGPALNPVVATVGFRAC